MKNVLIAAPISAKFRNFLSGHHHELISFEDGIGNFDGRDIYGIVTSNKLKLDQLALLNFPSLRWIARLGSGMEIIDTAWCRSHDIQYFSSPAGIANSVAEHVTGMLLSLLHKISSAHQEIKNGQWIREANRGVELQSLTVGIIGYGHTGKALAKKLSAFTDEILVYDKYKEPTADSHVKAVSLDSLQQSADIISFHVPLNAETRHYYNTDFVSKMQKPHILINASRGAVADTSAVLSGLRSGKINGACLDVLEEEHNIEAVLKQDNNIVQLLLQQNVILTPHIAGYSHNAIDKMCDELMLQMESIV